MPLFDGNLNFSFSLTDLPSPGAEMAKIWPSFSFLQFSYRIHAKVAFIFIFLFIRLLSITDISFVYMPFSKPAQALMVIILR